MDELTSIVTSTLEARGVLNKIRAELRANVFSAIQEQQGAPDSAPNPALETLQRTSHGQVAAKVARSPTNPLLALRSLTVRERPCRS